MFGQFTVGGGAIDSNCDCFKLTVPFPQQVGSVWHNDPINLNQSFDLKFELFFGCNDQGADGLVFALQPYGPLGGVIGAGLGMEGIAPSLGIYFDTHQNENLGDPEQDHVTLHRHGVVDHNSGHQLTNPVTLSNIEDCDWHIFHVKWDYSALSLKAWLDDVLVVDYNADIILTALWGINEVYWGFSASTGNAFNLHQICHINELQFDFETTSFENCPNTPIIFFDETDAYFQNVEWNWDFGDGSTGVGFNTVHAFEQTGFFNVTLYSTDDQGCEHSGTKQIEIKYPYLQAQAYPSTICDGMTATLVPFMDTIYPMNYLWYSLQAIANPEHPVTNVTPTSSDYYILHVWDSINPDYCHGIDTLFIPVIPYPNVGQGGSFTICTNDGPTDLASLAEADPGGKWMPPLAYINDLFYPHLDSSGVYAYAFPQCQTDTVFIEVELIQSPNPEIIEPAEICIASEPFYLQSVTSGGYWSGPGIESAETGLFNPVAAGLGSHSVYYQFDGICPSIDHTVVNVYSTLANMLIPNRQFCVNEPATSLFQIEADAIWWGNGIINTTSGIFSPGLAGVGLHQITVAYETTCDDTLNFWLEVLPEPEAEVVWPNGAACAPLTASFQLNSLSNLSQCVWNFGDNSSQSLGCGSVSHTFSSSGLFLPQLMITDNNGCSVLLESTQSIEVLETSRARFELKPQISEMAQNQVEFVNLSQNAHNFQWNFGDGTYSELVHPIHHFDPAIPESEVCLYAFHINGCTSAYCQTHRVAGAPLFYAPNAFTPDGDGLNDIFKIELNEPILYRLSIYNQQGRLLFDSEDGSKGWDGGEETAGVYIWVATASTPFRLREQGFVNLIR
jgi:PKD repeat protein